MIRRVLEADRYATTYRCGWCRTVSREEVDLDVRGLLQREWEGAFEAECAARYADTHGLNLTPEQRQERARHLATVLHDLGEDHQ